MWLLTNFYTKLDLKYIISPYHKPLLAVICKGKDRLFREKINFLVLEDRKFKLLLSMSLVFRASTKIYFSDSDHILKFAIKGFDDFFFNSGNLLSSIDQCMGHSDIQVIMLLPLHMKEITWKRTVYIFSFLFIF